MSNRLEAESLMREMAAQVEEGLGDAGHWYLLISYNFDGDSALSWISNGEKQELILALREMLQRLESNAEDNSKLS